MTTVRIAIPSEGEGGLDGMRAGHFGHCDVFTFIDLVNGEIGEVSILENVSHSQGGCMVPVKLLASHKVDKLIVGGIGMRPLMGFQQVGIDVYHEPAEPRIRPVVESMIAGRIPLITENEVCGAGGR